MKNCDENQNLMSMLKNMFILCTDVYFDTCICNKRPCFIAFSSCCKRKIFFLCRPNFVSITRVKGSLLFLKKY